MNTVDNIIAKRFRPIVERAHQLEEWQQCLEVVLDPGLRSQVKVANLVNECLVLQVDSPTWATRVRFITPQILTSLAPPKGLKIKEIKCIVRPDANALKPKKRRIVRHLPPEASHLISMTADVIKDPELKRAMQKLSEI